MAESTPTDATGDQSTMLPASFAQELMWMIERASPGNSAYNVPRIRRLLGALDVVALQRACDALVARHEVLRTTFATVDERVAQVVHEACAVPFDVVDLRERPAGVREAEAADRLREDARRPFDLSRDVLLRVTLVRLADDEHLLLLASHHVAFDGWSRDIVFRELAACYVAFLAGREPALPALPIQYADFAIWQREHLAGDVLANLLNYWRGELAGAEFELRLPTDFPRPRIAAADGVTEALLLSPALRDAIARLAQQAEATPYMVLLTAYASVLHRHTGQADVLVGSPIAGRTQPETEGLIGYFANTIVQRARFAGDPGFRTALSRLRESALAAYDHQDVPFEKLVLELQGGAASGMSPIFQVVLTQLDATNAPDGRFGDVRLVALPMDVNTTKFDLTLFMSDRPEGLQLSLRARSDLYRSESVARLLAQVRCVLEAAVADPDVKVGDIDLRSDSERAALPGWQGVHANEGPGTTVVALFEAQVDRAPSRPAVVGLRATATAGDATGTPPLTFAEVESRANQLAHRLGALGVNSGDRVGLLLDRSADAIVALLGILKAGAAYVPLALDAPATRVAQMIAECGARVVVTDAAHAEVVPAGIDRVVQDREAEQLGALPTTRLGPRTTADGLAYVLFTSGSTGVP